MPDRLDESLEAMSPLRRQGNLTGIPRKVKDSCADWHNFIQRWENLTVAGKIIIQKIANLKLQSVEGLQESGEERLEIVEDMEGGVTEQNAILESYCEDLGNVYEQLHQLTKKMEKITENFEGLLKLQEFQLEADGKKSHLLPIFKTWTADLFCRSSRKLMLMFQKEFEFKRCIIENVAHTVDRSLLTFMMVMWTHQPYIKYKAKLIIESMLIETGHR